MTSIIQAYLSISFFTLNFPCVLSVNFGVCKFFGLIIIVGPYYFHTKDFHSGHSPSHSPLFLSVHSR